MVACAVLGCTTRSDRSLKSEGITFHSFPSDPIRQALWVTALKRKDWKPTKYSKICSQHFRTEDLDRTSVSTVRIRENAVPSIIPTHSPGLRKKNRKKSPQARRKKVVAPTTTTTTTTTSTPAAAADTSGSHCQVSSFAANNTSECLSEKPDEAPVLVETKTDIEEAELPPADITPVRKCFVCSKEAGSAAMPLKALTNTTKICLHQKLSRVIGAELDLVVDEDGVICHECCCLLNHIDRIEVEHRLLTKSVVDRMRRTLDFHSAQSDNVPVEKCKVILDVPEKDTSDNAVPDTSNDAVQQDTSNDAVQQKKTVTPSETDGEKENQTPPAARVPEKKTDAEEDKQYYICKICNFKIKHKSVFLFHLQRHLQSNYRCDFCNKLLPKDLSYWIARMEKQAG